MNTELSALTRPRIASGVSSCTSVCRMTTLTMSAAPETASASIDSATEVESANTPIASPNTATAAISRWPAPRSIGWRVSQADISSAPAAGAARSRPRPQGPVCRMSLAKIGSSAVAPPSSTANRSSEMAPSSTGLSRRKCTPANTSPQRALPRGGGDAWRMPAASTAPTPNSTALTPYTADAPATYKKPPSAGPLMMASCMPLEPSATARGSKAAGTSSAGSAWVAGIWKARVMPSTTDSARISSRPTQPWWLPAVSTPATAAWASTQPSTMRARWWRSATWPAGSVISSAGRNCASPTRPRSQALPVRSYICQPSATIIIWLASCVASRVNQKRT